MLLNSAESFILVLIENLLHSCFTAKDNKISLQEYDAEYDKVSLSILSQLTFMTKYSDDLFYVLGLR
jgi:hypothetical protein